MDIKEFEKLTGIDTQNKTAIEVFVELAKKFKTQNINSLLLQKELSN